jgi:hypothetical protein
MSIVALGRARAATFTGSAVVGPALGGRALSCEWFFYSFAMDKFRRLFGHGTGKQEQALVDVVTNRDWYDFEDPELAERVARRAVREGLSYARVSKEEAGVLDCLLEAAIKGPGRLSKDLAAEPESPEGLHINVVEELLRRARRGKLRLKLLPIFGDGRRYGETKLSHCSYAAFPPGEVSALLAEVRRVVGLAVPWRHPDFPGEVEKELLGPLGQVAKKRRALAGFAP